MDSGEVEGRTLAAGSATGRVLRLDEPLSLWGGMDPGTGRIIDRRHPQAGQSLAGRVVVMPAGRGSSSSSSVLAEAIRAGTAPAALVLREADPILALGALVASELYDRQMPVVVIDERAHAAIRAGDEVVVRAGPRGASVRGSRGSATPRG